VVNTAFVNGKLIQKLCGLADNNMVAVSFLCVKFAVTFNRGV
jgi:hypothetical protein